MRRTWGGRRVGLRPSTLRLELIAQVAHQTTPAEDMSAEGLAPFGTLQKTCQQRV